MLRIKCDTVVYAMSPDNAPAARAKDGDTILFETQDCFSGQIQKETDQLGTLDWSRINPATGPVYIEGAQPGNTLKVEILRIDLAPPGGNGGIPGQRRHRPGGYGRAHQDPPRWRGQGGIQ